MLPRNSRGEIKAVASTLSYKELGETSILYKNRFGQLSIGQATADWFVALVAAVERAPKELNAITPRYIGHHVSANVYPHLAEFLDVLCSHPQLCPGWIVVGIKKEQREGRKLMRDLNCLGAWSPSFPRRVSKNQFWANDMNDLSSYASRPTSKLDFFMSVYSFPKHVHAREGGNPPIDTLFIDLDIESEKFSELRRAWEEGNSVVLAELLAVRENLLNEVLRQAQTLVDYLIRHNIQPRILLSGFKGVHVFIDFSPVQFSRLSVAKQILSKLTYELKTETGVVFDPTVVGDVSRLCRMPNTPHFDASRLLGRPQYAVPVTPDELTSLMGRSYDEMCSNPRFIPISRRESTEVLAVLTRIEQDMDLDEVAMTPKRSVSARLDTRRLEAYESEGKKEILEDEEFDELDVRPCFARVHRERIALEGSGGHTMRIGAVMELAMQELSIASMVRWFSFCADYDRAITEAAVKDIISRGYTDKHIDECGSEHRKGLRCETIKRCGFCLEEECPIFKRKLGRR
jgi:hypothetical protein